MDRDLLSFSCISPQQWRLLNLWLFCCLLGNGRHLKQWSKRVRSHPESSHHFLLSEQRWKTLLQLEPPCPPERPEGHCHPSHPPSTSAALCHVTPRDATSRHAAAGAAPRCPQDGWGPKRDQRLSGKMLADVEVRRKVFEGFSVKTYCSETVVRRGAFTSAWRAFGWISFPQDPGSKTTAISKALPLALKWWVDLW